MIIVCSFLFPIGLCGVDFAGDMMHTSVTAVLCANIYALLLKLVIFDVGIFVDFDLGDIHNLQSYVVYVLMPSILATSCWNKSEF